MVAAGGAGLNINPRGCPGHAPVLVRFRLNSRNHAAVVARSSQTVPAKDEKRACESGRRADREEDEEVTGTGRWKRVDDYAMTRAG